MNLCAQCARYERTCCQRTEVLVTEADICRITDSVGQSDFWEYRQPADPAYLEEQPHDRHWLAYTVRPDGSRPVLKHAPSGDCIFLSPSGCSLRLEVRPLVCRLYPYDYTEQRITGTVPGCPLYLLEPRQTLSQGIGIQLEDAKRWRMQLYAELRAGKVWQDKQQGHASLPPEVPAVATVAGTNPPAKPLEKGVSVP
jgi:Fe-S-cluster containining protein